MTATMTNLALNGSTGLQSAAANPDKANRILILFADGASLREMERETGANIRTIRAYLQHQGVWGACAKAIAATARVALKQLTDRLVNESHDIKLENIPGAMKAAADIAASLDGAPQTIIEHRHNHTHSITEPTMEAIQAFKAKMQGRQVIEVDTCRHWLMADLD